MKPEATKYSSSFGTIMYFGAPGPGWVKIGRPLEFESDSPEGKVYEWALLRSPDLIELADAASSATSKWAAKDSGVRSSNTISQRREWMDKAWWAWIAVRRFFLRLRGKELIAHSGPNLRWTLAYNKDDEESHRLGQQMILQRPLWPDERDG